MYDKKISDESNHHAPVNIHEDEKPSHPNVNTNTRERFPLLKLLTLMPDISFNFATCLFVLIIIIIIIIIVIVIIIIK